MATARSIISAALRKIGVIADEETPRASWSQDSLLALNAMLAAWGTSNLLVPRITQETITVSSASYTLTTRPMRVLDSTVNDGTYDYGVASLSREDWFSITDKNFPGIPSALWWDEKMTSSKVYFWPVPDASYSVTLQRWDAIDSFASLDTTMTLPAEYERALIFNLAIEIAPEFGTSVSTEVAAIASGSVSALARYHAKEVPTLRTDLIGISSRKFSTGYAEIAFKRGW